MKEKEEERETRKFDPGNSRDWKDWPQFGTVAYKIEIERVQIYSFILGKGKLFTNFLQAIKNRKFV